jgi:peroxiredoxin Q/BCP
LGLRDRIKGALGLVPSTHLAEGATAPEIGVADANGRQWRTMELRGRPAVIYFYPKDDTPGCTKEACSFRDRRADLGDVALFGVSTDAADSHRAFAQKFNLPFPLLADPGGAMTQRWGAGQGLRAGARRVTFVLDREGRIARIFDPVRVEGHTDEVIAALRELP